MTTASEVFYNLNIDKSTKMIRLFALTQIYYRQPEGEKAIEYLHTLIGQEETSTLFFLCGFCHGETTREMWIALLEGC